MAQMGSRETEEKVRIKPRAVAQAGATRPLTRLSGDQFTTENRKVAFRRQSTTVKAGLDTGPYVVNAKTYCMSQFTLVPLTHTVCTVDLVPGFYSTSRLFLRIIKSKAGLTVHTAGVRYFQHSLKTNRGFLPVMCLMLALKRSAPAGENSFIMTSSQLLLNL